MNYNPRKLALALGTALALTLTATGCGHASGGSRVQTPSVDRPDCDLGDLKEGDPDCNDPIAYSEAVHKYGPKKVADAQRQYAEKQAKKRAKKYVPTPRPQSTTNPSLPKKSGGWNPFSKKTKATPTHK